MKIYSLRKTDGYDANELLQVSEDRNLLMSWIVQDPPDVVDYYIIETWEDGLMEDSEAITYEEV